MKEKHHFAADVDADYYMANSGYGVSNYDKQIQFVSICHKYNCESIKKTMFSFRSPWSILQGISSQTDISNLALLRI